MAAKEERMLFHLLAGCFLMGKSYADYCEMFADSIPLNGSNGLPIKGNKSLKAFTKECYEKAKKHLKILEGFLGREPSTFEMAKAEVDRIESITSSLLMLSPKGQERVRGLIAKLQKEQSEIDFWIEFEKEQNEKDI